MAHKRKEIRAEWKARLMDATDCDERVFDSRLAPITLDMLQNEGPALLIYVRDEHIAASDYSITGQNGTAKRHIEVTVEIVAKGSSTVDDVLDDIASQVEAVIEDFQMQVAPAAEIRLTETEIDVSDAFESPVGSCSMTYGFDYYSAFRETPTPPVPGAAYVAPFSGAREPLTAGA